MTYSLSKKIYMIKVNHTNMKIWISMIKFLMTLRIIKHNKVKIINLKTWTHPTTRSPNLLLLNIITVTVKFKVQFQVTATIITTTIKIKINIYSKVVLLQNIPKKLALLEWEIAKAKLVNINNSLWDKYRVKENSLNKINSLI